jgi:orotate phosphoribosyltransferase
MMTPEKTRELLMQRSIWTQARDSMLNNAVSTEKEFTLASGRKSKFYVDCRLAACNTAVGRNLGHVINAALDCIKPSNSFWAIAPVPMGGLLIVARLMSDSSFVSKSPWLIPRVEKKGHGRKQSVEGLYDLDGNRMVSADYRVLVIEDVVTSGGSSLKAVEVLREEGLKVDGVLAVVDREEGAAGLLKMNDLQLWSVFRKKDFLPEGE